MKILLIYGNGVLAGIIAILSSLGGALSGA